MLRFFKAELLFKNASAYLPRQASLPAQLQPHEHQLLPPGQAGTEALWVPAVLHKAHALVQGEGAFVLCDRLQLQLDIPGSPGAFDAGFSQSPPDPETPVRLVHADAKLRAVSGLFLAGNTGNTGRANYRTVNKRKEFDFIGTICLSPQQLRLVLGGIAVLLRVREQIIRLRMGEVEDLEQSLPVLRRSVSQRAGSAIFRVMVL